MEPKKNRQNKIIPRTQLASTFNNQKKIIKPNSEKYNIPGSLNNTASSSFQNQQKNISINNQSQNSINGNNNINNLINNPLIIETNGDKPLPRFGHSLVMINPIKICIFGGVVGEICKIVYSNETFIYNIMTKIWLQLNFDINKTILPSPRAAHAAAANNQMQMVIYGGSDNLGLADDKLWVLHLSEKNEGLWDEIKTVGQTPGQRYGHSLCYSDPYFIYGKFKS